MESVAIFWDYENCRPASNISGYSVANNIRRAAHNFGSVKLFKAYLALSESSSSRFSNLRSELQSSGVSLTDCPHNGKKDVADKMIIVDMLSYAIDNPGPSTIILISGDRDFAYATSVLRLRRYRVVVMAPTVPSVHISLKSQASIFLDWNTDVMGKTVEDRSDGRTSCVASPSLSPKSNAEHASYTVPPPPTTSRQDCPTVCCELSSKDRCDALNDKTLKTWLLDTKKPTKCHEDNPLLRNSWLKMNGPSVVCSSDIQRPASIKLECTVAGKRQPSSPTKSLTTRAFIKAPSWWKTSKNTNAEVISSSCWSYADGQPHQSVTLLSNTIPMANAPSTSPTHKTFSFVASTFSYPRPTRVDITDIGYEYPRTTTMNSSSGPRTRPPELAVQDTDRLGHNPAGTLANRVPSEFRVLLEMLQYQHMQGVTRVPRASFAETLKRQDKMVYEKAGVTKFRQYVAQAEKAGIVQLGLDKKGGWISLHPHWHRTLNVGRKKLTL